MNRSIVMAILLIGLVPALPAGGLYAAVPGIVDVPMVLFESCSASPLAVPPSVPSACVPTPVTEPFTIERTIELNPLLLAERTETDDYINYGTSPPPNRLKTDGYLLYRTPEPVYQRKDPILQELEDRDRAWDMLQNMFLDIDPDRYRRYDDRPGPVQKSRPQTASPE